MEKRIILIAEEFPSHSGGVAYFSDVLAKQYHKAKGLRGVISLSPEQAEHRSFLVLHVPLAGRTYGSMPLDRVWFMRKLNSLLIKTYDKLTGRKWQPVVKALKNLDYNPNTDVLFFTYQVHQPDLFRVLHKIYNGEQWTLYHGLDLIGFQKFPAPVVYASKHASKILFNSKATQQLFYDLGFSTEVPQEVIYPFLDEAYLNSLELYTCSQVEQQIQLQLKDAIVVTSICRLVKRKGLHYAIDIVASLIKERKFNIQYLIGGNGPEMEFLKEKVNALGLNAHIHFLGYIDDLLKYSILKESKVFLMPNYDDGGGDFEGFGISFLEAGYFNNHVIAGNHGGAIEAMQHLKHFSLIDVKDEASLKLVELKLSEIIGAYAN